MDDKKLVRRIGFTLHLWWSIPLYLEFQLREED